MTALVNTAGTVVERYSYDPYGKETIYDAAWTTRTSSAFSNEQMYCGYRKDPETVIYYVRSRTYHPTLGRWLERDPLGYDDGMDLYQYVRSNPINLGDPMGLEAVCGGMFLEDGIGFARAWGVSMNQTTPFTAGETTAAANAIMEAMFRARKSALMVANAGCRMLGCPPATNINEVKRTFEYAKEDHWEESGWVFQTLIKCTSTNRFSCPPKPKEEEEPSRPKQPTDSVKPPIEIPIPIDPVKPQPPTKPPGVNPPTGVKPPTVKPPVTTPTSPGVWQRFWDWFMDRHQCPGGRIRKVLKKAKVPADVPK